MTRKSIKGVYYLLRELGAHPRDMERIFMVGSQCLIACNLSNDGPKELYNLGILLHNIQSLGNKVMALNVLLTS
jgi:hypothetical protein